MNPLLSAALLSTLLSASWCSGAHAAEGRTPVDLPVPTALSQTLGTGGLHSPAGIAIDVSAAGPAALVHQIGLDNAAADRADVRSDSAQSDKGPDTDRAPVDQPIAPGAYNPLFAAALAQPLKLLESTVAPGSFASLTWESLDTSAASNLPATVLVAHGAARGPVYCLTAAVHGDELNGIETVRRILYTLDTGRLRGTVIGVPIVNVQGFNRGSRYLPDRRDLNRYFPGNRRGSAAARIAHSLFTHVIRYCDALVDLHTGSFQRTNLPQIRADLADPGALALTEGFGSAVVLHNGGQSGTLRAAATRAGIAAVTLEAGGPMQLQPDAVAASEAAIRTLLHTKGLYRVGDRTASAPPSYYRSSWVRTDHGGILASQVSLGANVAPGDLLGTVVDPLTNEQTTIRAPRAGRIIGMAFDQFVLPGYATFHLGVEASVEACIEGDDEAEDPDTEAAETENGETEAAETDPEAPSG